MRYTTDTLIDYCNNNNVALIENYNDNCKLNRESYIQGNCIYNYCKKNFNKNFRQLVKTGAYCDDCIKIISSNKIREHKVVYNKIMLQEFCDANNILLYNDFTNVFINRDTIINGTCLTPNCDNDFNKPFRDLLKINGYCENCSKENGKEKIKETNLKKFGFDNPMKNETIKEKQKNTMIEKYGVEHNSQLEEFKLKKINTYMTNFGVSSHLKSPEIREQIKQTNLKKYGFENPQQNQEVKNKNVNTTLERYGVKYYSQSSECKEKIQQTNLEKYGVLHHSQNAEVADTMLKNAYNNKKYTLPSGKIIDYQGYENYALDELLNVKKIDETDIITNRKDVPEIWYNDKNNKRRRHYVDFYIKSQNRCIEVKSTWTNQEKNNVFEKQKAAQELGYIYDIWIYDRNGNITNTY